MAFIEENEKCLYCEEEGGTVCKNCKAIWTLALGEDGFIEDKNTRLGMRAALIMKAYHRKEAMNKTTLLLLLISALLVGVIVLGLYFLS